MTEPSFTLLAGVTSGDMKKLREKIARFSGRISDIHIVADFDRTLTDRRPGSYEDITSWNILRERLPPEGQGHYEEIFRTFRPKELAGTMTEEDAVAWWSGVLDTYTEYRIDMNDVEHDFLHRATIRGGGETLICVMPAAGHTYSRALSGCQKHYRPLGGPLRVPANTYHFDRARAGWSERNHQLGKRHACTYP